MGELQKEMERCSFSEMPPPGFGGKRKQKWPSDLMVTVLDVGLLHATAERARTRAMKKINLLDNMNCLACVCV